MDENQAGTLGTPEDAVETPQAVNVRNPDYFLRSLITFAQSGIETPVTLMVGGVLITGHIASGRHYFEEIAQDFVGGFRHFGSESLMHQAQHTIAQWAELYPTVNEDGTVDDQGNPLDPNNAEFIHLRNANIILQGGSFIPGDRRMWWRGRLGAIDSFMMGALNGHLA